VLPRGQKNATSCIPVLGSSRLEIVRAVRQHTWARAHGARGLHGIGETNGGASGTSGGGTAVVAPARLEPQDGSIPRVLIDGGERRNGRSHGGTRLGAGRPLPQTLAHSRRHSL